MWNLSRQIKKRYVDWRNRVSFGEVVSARRNSHTCISYSLILELGLRRGGMIGWQRSAKIGYGDGKVAT